MYVQQLTMFVKHPLMFGFVGFQAPNTRPKAKSLRLCYINILLNAYPFKVSLEEYIGFPPISNPRICYPILLHLLSVCKGFNGFLREGYIVFKLSRATRWPLNKSRIMTQAFLPRKVNLYIQRTQFIRTHTTQSFLVFLFNWSLATSDVHIILSDKRVEGSRHLENLSHSKPLRKQIGTPHLDSHALMPWCFTPLVLCKLVHPLQES